MFQRLQPRRHHRRHHQREQRIEMQEKQKLLKQQHQE